MLLGVPYLTCRWQLANLSCFRKRTIWLQQPLVYHIQLMIYLASMIEKVWIPNLKQHLLSHLYLDMLILPDSEGLSNLLICLYCCSSCWSGLSTRKKDLHFRTLHLNLTGYWRYNWLFFCIVRSSGGVKLMCYQPLPNLELNVIIIFLLVKTKSIWFFTFLDTNKRQMFVWEKE